MMKNKKPDKSITLTIGDDVKRVPIPRGLRVVALDPRFTDWVFSEVIPQLNDTNYQLTMGGLTTKRGFMCKILYVTINKKLYWGVKQYDGYLACGVFNISNISRVEGAETLAAALPQARGQGLYTAVLIYLREALDKKLVSDSSLTLANFIIWSTIGVADNVRGRPDEVLNTVGRLVTLRRHPISDSEYAKAVALAKSIIAVEVA